MTLRLRRALLRLALLAAVGAGLFGCASVQQAERTLIPGTLAPRTTAPVASISSLASPLPLTPTPSSTATATQTATASPTATAPPAPSPTPAPLRIAVIGDYGSGSPDEADVAALVKSWNPDLILTTGDNNYPAGEAGTLDRAVGQFYHEYIAGYRGDYGEGSGEGSDTNRFFPVLGNHDWQAPGAKPYLDYFSLPGNERYYDFSRGPVRFFALDSDPSEPDGVGKSSDQADWLKQRLAESTEPWKVVYFHHPPFSSGIHGNIDWMNWPFKKWGADLVLSGHDHTYERLEIDGLTYIINGLGGGAIYSFEKTAPGSQVRFNADYGAQLIEATPDSLTLQFITRAGEVVDTYTLTP